MSCSLSQAKREKSSFSAQPLIRRTNIPPLPRVNQNSNYADGVNNVSARLPSAGDALRRPQPSSGAQRQISSVSEENRSFSTLVLLVSATIRKSEQQSTDDDDDDEHTRRNESFIYEGFGDEIGPDPQRFAVERREEKSKRRTSNHQSSSSLSVFYLHPLFAKHVSTDVLGSTPCVRLRRSLPLSSLTKNSSVAF